MNLDSEKILTKSALFKNLVLPNFPSRVEYQKDQKLKTIDVLLNLHPGIFGRTYFKSHSKFGTKRNFLQRTGETQSLVDVNEIVSRHEERGALTLKMIITNCNSSLLDSVLSSMLCNTCLPLFTCQNSSQVCQKFTENIKNKENDKARN